MAYVKCSGGGKLKETKLWENPNPSASTFLAQTIILNDSITNFEYIEVEFQPYYNLPASTGKCIYLVGFFITLDGSNSSEKPTKAVGPSVKNGSNYDVIRPFYYVSDTSIHFDAYFYKGGGGNGATNVPLYIYGLK